MIASIDRERRIPVIFALLLYGSMAAAAIIWIHFGGTQTVSQMVRADGMVRPVLWGLLTGMLLAGVAAAMSVTFLTFRELEIEFAGICADQRGGEIIVLAVLSGAAEELFFRGAMQPRLIGAVWRMTGAAEPGPDGFDAFWGILLASVIFGVFHIPFSRRLLIWPVLAAVAGVILGLLMLWTGSLLAPAVAHMVINAVGFWRIAHRYGTAKLEFE